MATYSNVHVGDVGTLYKAMITENSLPFDPSEAVEKKLIFKTPLGVLERNATITTNGTNWFLEYTVTPSDTTFHGKKGTYKWQGYLRFVGGEEYHTNIEKYKVDKNLN